MKNSLLLPNRYKVIGWVIFLAVILLLLAKGIFDFEVPKVAGFTWIENYKWADNNIIDEIMLSIALISLIFICFSREKYEDEYISFLRLKSWQWAVLVSYGILFVANWLIYGSAFLSFMIHNMFTVLCVFIVKFNYSLYRLKREKLGDETILIASSPMKNNKQTDEK